jgi:hypothetical protein
MSTKNSSVFVRYQRIETNGKVPNVVNADRLYSSEKTGVGLTNWKRIIATGGSATTGASSILREGKSKPGFVRVNFRVNPDGVWPSGVAEATLEGRILVPTIFETGSLGVAQADAQAIQRLYADLRSIQTEMSGPTFLGELRESFRMIRRPAQGLLRGLNRYALAQRKIIKVHPKWQRYERKTALANALTDSWLEHSYGWAPLINDVKSIAKTIARLYDTLGSRKTARGYGEFEQVLGSSTSLQNYGGVFYGQETTLRKHKTIVIYKAWVDPNLGSPPASLQRLRDLAGFNLSEFVPTVWELIPYSFVVDYFSNVGQVLSAYTFNAAVVKFVKKDSIYETRETRSSLVDSSATKNALGAASYLGAVGSFGSCESRTKQVIRTSVALPLPELQLDMPDIDSLKWLNLAALFRNLLVH